MSFLRSLLNCGFAAFGGVPARKVLSDSTESLQKLCENAFSEVKREMVSLTPALETTMGQAGGGAETDPWPALHHRFAHGKLKWLSIHDGKKQELGLHRGLIGSKISHRRS